MLFFGFFLEPLYRDGRYKGHAILACVVFTYSFPALDLTHCRTAFGCSRESLLLRSPAAAAKCS